MTFSHKKLSCIVAACGLALALNAQAASVGTMKIFTGNHGGVVTLQKRVHKPQQDAARSNGMITVSDVRFALMRDGEERATEADRADDAEVVDVVDAERDTDGTLRARISGRAHFVGEAAGETRSGSISINGGFKVFNDVIHGIRLVDILATREGEAVVLSGGVVIDGVEYRINEAPEKVQRLVRRLLWAYRRH